MPFKIELPDRYDIPHLENLHKIQVTPQYMGSLIPEVIRIASLMEFNKNRLFNEIVTDAEKLTKFRWELWDRYIEKTKIEDAICNQTPCPKGLKHTKDFIKWSFLLNAASFASAITEKTIMEKAGVEEQSTIFSFVSYLSSKYFPRGTGVSEELIRQYQNEPDFSIIFKSMGGNTWAIKSMIELYRETEPMEEPEFDYDFESADPIKDTYFRDNVYDAFWFRPADILATHALFFKKISESVYFESERVFIPQILNALEEQELKASVEYSRNISIEQQEVPHGIASLEAILSSFGHETQNSEKGAWLRRFESDSSPISLPTTLLKAALQKGCSGYLLMDTEQFEEKSDITPKFGEALSLGIMLSDMKDLEVLPVKKMKGSLARKIVYNGGVLMFARETEGDLSYNIAHGYNEGEILITNPKTGEIGYVSFDEFENISRNDYMTFGLAIFPREHPINPFILEHILKTKKTIADYFGEEFVQKYDSVIEADRITN